VSRAAPPGAAMSIGEVLGRLRADFPDVTISKIRFLEAEGLVEPERTPSGYRKFSAADVERLRYVLAAQRDQYLPLKVIKEHLDAIDRGLEPPAPTGGGPRVPAAAGAAEADTPPAESFARTGGGLRLSRDELIEAAAVDADQLVELETYGLVTTRADGLYDTDALLVVKTVAAMAAYGLQARHLRPFKAAADREIGLIEQVIAPLQGQRGPDARERADEVVRELAALSVRLHATLVRAGLDRM
jgi:DNA-binding transcriptional MerR regulator